MPGNVEPAEGEVSDAMSENEHDEYDDSEAFVKDEDDKMTEQNVSSETGEVKKKWDPKDPARPRRKKARRACFACQRAHLTCGDERPCQRCIKRGLADACQDGVRKKAKYLHDAPAEALRPVLGPNFNQSATPTRPGPHRQLSNASDTASVGSFYPPSGTSGFPIFSAPQTSMGPMPDGLSFGSQQSPLSPTFQSGPQVSNMTVPQVSSDMSTLAAALFDPSNPAIYNFNLEGLNFGSQYGGLEFAMLGHMSSGAAETPTRDHSASKQGGDVPFGSAGLFGNGANQFDQVYDGGMVPEFVSMGQSANGMYSQGNLQHGLPHAYAIAAGPPSLASPSTDNNSPQPTNMAFEGSPTTGTYHHGPNGCHVSQAPRPKSKVSSAMKRGPQTFLGKRRGDPSAIYETVKEPYPYVKGFHRLTEVLRNRFSPAKSIKIAKSLSAIRPSFISCTKTLNRQDLIFMEKCTQRTMFEYEEFMHHTPAPTIVCRRTGEVAAVNKEFTALTGWTKNILLGKEPNLHVSTVESRRSSTTTSISTPRLKALGADDGQGDDGTPRPVFLAELLDDDSVVEFYEDFAHLAFNDSRGSVTRKCRLLKYRTKGDGEGAESTPSPEQKRSKDPRSSILSNRVTRIDGEHGISKIERDGKLECSYCWTIKRDLFEIPMLIVVNFLPCGQQLAV